jgi:hypothetical protein
MTDVGTRTSLSQQLRAAAWSGRHPGDSLYGLTPIPVDLAVKALILAAQLEARGE